MLSGVMIWPFQPPVHCEYFSLYNVKCSVVPCYGTYTHGTVWVLQFLEYNMLSDVMLLPLHTPVHCEYFSLYNVTCLVVSCYGPYTIRYTVSTLVCKM